VAGELKQMGIEVDISGAGGHVARIERRIRTIKERVRAHIAGKQPYSLTALGIAMLVLFCVSRYNFQMSELREDGTSPRELFTGRGASGKLDFRVGFGEYCQCTVPNTDNSMSERTEDCISVLSTGNRSGLVHRDGTHRNEGPILRRTDDAVRSLPTEQTGRRRGAIKSCH
jgi:hypothetical protein